MRAGGGGAQEGRRHQRGAVPQRCHRVRQGAAPEAAILLRLGLHPGMLRHCPTLACFTAQPAVAAATHGSLSCSATRSSAVGEGIQWPAAESKAREAEVISVKGRFHADRDILPSHQH